MSIEVLVNKTPQETRVAIVEQGILQEVIIERSAKRGLVGNIYKGKVQRVLPGMEAAFVDIGMDQSAFLHLSDIKHSDKFDAKQKALPINSIFHEGQQILVQVIKDPLGTKGARLTTQLTIPTRYLVLVVNEPGVSMSARVEDPNERERLTGVVNGLVENVSQRHGYIIRTAAEGAEEEAFTADIRYLGRLWEKIAERTARKDNNRCVYADLPLIKRTLRDLVGVQIERISIEGESTYNEVHSFVKTYVPEMNGQLSLYNADLPLLERHAVEDEIQKALNRKVSLKSGGYIIFDQTESMTTVDVNTGGFVGHKNLEQTIFKTNLEAAQAICRQLRLRNLGGIIIVDFIDMLDDEHKRSVMRTLEKNLEKDSARTSVSDFSSLGLVEMTRKRTRESLEHVLCEPCDRCDGTGYLKTVETMCYEILRDIIREAKQFEAREVLVIASESVVNHMLEEESEQLAELETSIGLPIRCQADAQYMREQYDVVPL